MTFDFGIAHSTYRHSGFRSYYSEAIRAWRTGADTHLLALELFYRAFSERSKEARGGIRGKEILRDEELLQLHHVRTTRATGEISHERRTDGRRRLWRLRLACLLRLQHGNLCHQTLKLCLKLGEGGGRRESW